MYWSKMDDFIFVQNGFWVFLFWSEKFEYKSLIGILIEGGELCVAIISVIKHPNF